jgi:CBS-domain-containing membrane protein
MSRTVRDVMTMEVLTARESDPVKEIARWLAAGSVSALPVLDRDHGVVGVVSEADLLLRAGQPEGHGIRDILDPRRKARRGRATGRTALQLMTSPAITVRPEASVREAARIMTERGVKRLPVVDEAGRLVGIVSRADLIKLFVRPDEDIGREVREDVIHDALWIDPDTVLVEVHEGVVILQGQVERRSMIPVVVRLVESLDGVVGVESRLGYAVDDLKLHLEEALPWGVLPRERRT